MTPAFVLAFVPGATPGKWVSVWRQRLPTTPIELVALADDDGIHSLHDRSADVALLRLPFDGEGITAIPLYEEIAVVVAAKDHPVAAYDSLSRADLSGETLLPGADKATVELVAANVGLAIMPQSVARLYSRGDVIARRLDDEPTTRVALAWRANDDNPLIEEFIGIVRGRTANSSRGTVSAPARKR